VQHGDEGYIAGLPQAQLVSLQTLAVWYFDGTIKKNPLQLFWGRGLKERANWDEWTAPDM
jgi:hypothetical protein